MSSTFHYKVFLLLSLPLGHSVSDYKKTVFLVLIWLAFICFQNETKNGHRGSTQLQLGLLLKQSFFVFLVNYFEVLDSYYSKTSTYLKPPTLLLTLYVSTLSIWLYPNFLGKTSPRRTASASYQHSLPTAIVSPTQFSLPLVTIEKETSLLSGALDPAVSSLLTALTYRLLSTPPCFFKLFPSLSVCLWALRCIQGSITLNSLIPSLTPSPFQLSIWLSYPH